MDLLDELSTHNKNRTTYKKSVEVFEDDIHDPSKIQGNARLPGSSLLEKVKDRLNKKEEYDSSNEKSLKSSIYIHGYDGESLEKDFFNQSSIKHIAPNFAQDTQIIETCVQKDNELLLIRKNISTPPPLNFKESDQFSRTDISTQLITESSYVITPTIDDKRYLKKQTSFISEKNCNNKSLDNDIIQTLNDEKESQLLPTINDNNLDTQNISPYSEIYYTQDKPYEEGKKSTVIPVQSSDVLMTKKFSKESFFQLFDEFSEDEEVIDLNKNANNETKIKTFNNKDILVNDSISRTEIYQSVDTVSHQINPLNSYKQKLQNELNSGKFLELEDSSSDDKDDTHSSSKLCKAAILEIKAKMSKKQSTKTKLKTFNDSQSLKDLFISLKKANQKQIIDHRKEITEKKGLNLEEIEREREQVESLLEQEIERNKRIRLREIRQKKKTTKKESKNKLYSDISDTNIESDVPDSDESQHSNSISFDSNLSSDIDSDDEIIMNRHKHPPKKIANISDPESESESQDPITVTNIIDLGVYGININDSVSKHMIGENGLESCINQLPIASPVKKYPPNNDKKNIQLIGKTSNQKEMEYSSSGEMDQEDYKRLISKAIEKKKYIEYKERKRRKEIKKRGLNKIFEIEAEESEDEWHGVGGADGELSEEYDSEIEKMMDDYTKQNVDSNQIRQLLVAEEKKHDTLTVNKLLYDIKHGKLSKRSRNAMDLELSEDEDEYLQKYHIKRKELMRKRLLENTDNLIANPKSQPFFESIIEDVIDTHLFDKKSPQIDENDKERLVISQQFVQETLSFLSSYDDMQNEFQLNQNLEKLQRDVNDNDNREIDLFSLKQKSCIKVLNTPDIRSDSNLKDNMDENSSILGLKLPSVVQSFKLKENVNDKFEEGVKVVKTSKSYKAVGGSKTSITYFGKHRKLNAPKKSNTNKPKLVHNTPQHPSEKISSLFSQSDNLFDR